MTEKTIITEAIVLNWLQKTTEPVTVEEVLLHIRIAVGRYMPNYRDTLRAPGAYESDVAADRAVVLAMLEVLAGREIIKKIQNQATMGHVTYAPIAAQAVKAAEANPMMDVEAVLRRAAKDFGPKLLRQQVQSTLSKIEFEA